MNLQTAPLPHRPHLSRRLSGSAAARNPENYYQPMDVSSRFGVRLRQLRQERSLTQLRMATEFGIDRTFISDVERGRKSISLPILEVMALGFKMSLSELLRDI
jgi:DNA-binding XRE family transcriptional regulator